MMQVKIKVQEYLFLVVVRDVFGLSRFVFLNFHLAVLLFLVRTTSKGDVSLLSVDGLA